MIKPKKAIRAERGSGNVFADMGVPDPEASLVKAELAYRICKIIASRKLTAPRAAQLMGLARTEMTALRHGKLGAFSAERLFGCLNDLGQQIEITIRPMRPAGRRGHVQVAVGA